MSITTVPYKKPKINDWQQWYEQQLPTGLKAAGLYIQSAFKDAGIEFPQMRWIQTSLQRPAFQYLAFAYHGQIFSVLIELVNDEGETYLVEQDVDNQLRECAQNNLRPCIISLSSSNFEPLVGGCHLIDTACTGCLLYISPYQRIISTQAPKGFYLV